MRVGVMVGSDKERSRADRLAGLITDGAAAESAGFTTFWMPQIPGYLDAMTAVALIGQATERIEIGTAVVPIQTRHPMIMAQQALTTQVACAGRFTLGIGPSHHWIVDGQLGLSYDRPAQLMGDYLDVLHASFAGPGSFACLVQRVAHGGERADLPVERLVRQRQALRQAVADRILFHRFMPLCSRRRTPGAGRC